MDFVEALEQARACKKRNFKQSIDLIINLKNIDLRKPENRIKTDIVLPNPINKDIKICVFADALAPQLKSISGVIVVSKDEIERYAKDKRAAKKLAKRCYSFLAEAPLMPAVAKALGRVLAVRGKMPKPIPPNIKDLQALIERARSSVRLFTKDSPVVHCRIATEDMDNKKIAQNAQAVINGLAAVLPKGKEQIKNVYIKLTMGKAVKVKI